MYFGRVANQGQMGAPALIFVLGPADAVLSELTNAGYGDIVYVPSTGREYSDNYSTIAILDATTGTVKGQIVLPSFIGGIVPTSSNPTPSPAAFRHHHRPRPGGGHRQQYSGGRSISRVSEVLGLVARVRS